MLGESLSYSFRDDAIHQFFEFLVSRSSPLKINQTKTVVLSFSSDEEVTMIRNLLGNPVRIMCKSFYLPLGSFLGGKRKGHATFNENSNDCKKDRVCNNKLTII